MPTDRSQAVQVRGLAVLQRELKEVDLASDLKDANREAAEVTASAGRARASAHGGVLAKTAPSIKAAAEQRRSKVTLGSAREPWALGAEFGGQGRPTTMQFEPHLGRQGYGLYPAVRDTREEFIEVYARAMAALFDKAFPD